MRLGPLYEVGWSPEGANHFTKDLGGFSGVEGPAQFLLGLLGRSGETTGLENLGAEGQGHRLQPLVAMGSGQKLHGFAYFDCVARAVGKALVHVGEERGGRSARPGGNVRNALGKFLGTLVARHECSVTNLDIHHEGIEARGEFLGENGGRDQADRLDGGGDIAD